MQTTERIYTGRVNAYERELERLRISKLSARNKELITQFHNYLFSVNCGKARVTKLSVQLRGICSVLGKDLDSVTLEDVQNLVASYNKRGDYTNETKSDYRRCVKQFYKWFESRDSRLDASGSLRKEAVKVYDFIKNQIRRSLVMKEVDFSNVLTDKDVNQIVDNGCKTIKEKAFIKVLHEGGFRVGEMLNIKLKDITFFQNRVMVRVNGKTGERRVPLVLSMPFLVQWLQLHPYKDKSESYLWTGDSRSYLHQPLKYRGVQKLIERCFEKAGLIEKEYAEVVTETGKRHRKCVKIVKNRQHNPHWFRHSRATLLAPHLTEQLLCKFMGWRLGSSQVRRYCHLCTEQLENAILSMNGVEETKTEQTIEKTQLCRCGAPNASSSRYCFRCGSPLNVTVAVQDQEILRVETDRRLELYAQLMADPVKRKQFEEFKKLSSL